MRYATILTPLILAVSAASAVQLPYQGLATDSKGYPKSDGSYPVRFALYGDSASSSALWAELQVAATSKGLFSVMMGSSTEIPDSLFQRRSLYLGVSVDGGDELTPRLRLGYAPWAVVARRADTASVALKASGLDSLRMVLSASQDSLRLLRAATDSLRSQLAGIQTILKGVSRSGNEVYFDSVNVNVRNGLGSTLLTNGLGNLVVGYNEARGDTSDHRTGSHNLVVGKGNSFTSYGGAVIGIHNSSYGPFGASVGGSYNIAMGLYSTVAGGTQNTANGLDDAIVGGRFNVTNRVFGANGAYYGGYGATITGGYQNLNKGSYSLIASGINNMIGIGEEYALIAGGDSNSLVSMDGNIYDASAIVGGYGNQAPSVNVATVVGGTSDTAAADSVLLAGGKFNKAASAGAALLGGVQNAVTGSYATAVGGTGNSATQPYALVNGGQQNLASGIAAVVVGGNSDTALGEHAVAVGGEQNLASSMADVVVGGALNVSSGGGGLVAGGYMNAAKGTLSTVAGGNRNAAIGTAATIAGGTNETAPSDVGVFP